MEKALPLTENAYLEALAPDLTDTHAHLSHLAHIKNEAAVAENAEAAAKSADEYIKKLREKNFGVILDIGTRAGDLPERLAAFSDYEKIYFTGGIWPSAEAALESERMLAVLEQHIMRSPPGRVVAIGECGFDRRENPLAPPQERKLFELQLDLAQRLGLPVIVHSREAPQETFDTLKGFPRVTAVIHCFSYTREEAAAFLDQGCFISFAGNLTYKNAENLRDALKMIPAERLLLETDTPYLAPVPYRGKPCHPALIFETYKMAAALRGTTVEALAATIADNTQKLFLTPQKGR